MQKGYIWSNVSNWTLDSLIKTISIGCKQALLIPLKEVSYHFHKPSQDTVHLNWILDTAILIMQGYKFFPCLFLVFSFLWLFFPFNFFFLSDLVFRTYLLFKYMLIRNFTAEYYSTYLTSYCAELVFLSTVIEKLIHFNSKNVD